MISGFLRSSRRGALNEAALEAWGAGMNLFHQGFAAETHDSEVIAAATERPGVVLRRPVGSADHFSEHADLPTASSLAANVPKNKARTAKVAPGKRAEREETDKPAERRAAASFEKERVKREKQREQEEAAAARVREKRAAAIARAEAALAVSHCEHKERAAEIERV